MPGGYSDYYVSPAEQVGVGFGQAGGMGTVGSLVSALSSYLDQQRMKAAFEAQMNAQRQFAAQGAQTFQSGLAQQGSQVAQQQIAQGAANRNQQYSLVDALKFALPGMLQRSSSGGRDVAASQVAGNQRAQLGGYQDWQQQSGIANQQTQRGLNQISSFAGGSASVFPYEMYQAQHAYDWLAKIGALVSGLGRQQGGGYGA